MDSTIKLLYRREVEEINLEHQNQSLNKEKKEAGHF
jgi:hypothetical protein